MKTKVKIIKYELLLIIASLFCIFLSSNDLKAFFISLLSGFIASLVVIISEYQDCKINTLEIYYQQGLEFFNCLNIIKYDRNFINGDRTDLKMVNSKIEELECILNFDITEFGNTFAQIGFFWPCKRIDNEIIKPLYKRAVDLRMLIGDEYCHFKLLKEGEGNKNVCISKISSIHSAIFRIDKVETEFGIETKVFNVAGYEYLELLEKLRCIIYGIKYEKIKESPSIYYLDVKDECVTKLNN